VPAEVAAPAIATRLQRGMLLAGLGSAAILMLFVILDLDGVVDDHFRPLGLTGLAHDLGDHVMIPALFLLLPLLIASSIVIRKAMAPLAAAARDLHALDDVPRGHRVSTDRLPAEVVPFVDALNGLLARLETAAERQEAFAADVAHELKNPLAVLTVELDRLGAAARPLLADVRAMSRLVDQLMLIAQLDADAAAHTRRDQIDLADIARCEVARIAEAAVREGKHVELVATAESVVMGRREAIAAALRNLLENALRVTPAGGRVVVLIGPEPSIRVRDEGPGLTSEELATLQRRSVRADYANPVGAGLGLSIVTKIMASHHGCLSTDPGARELKLDFAHAAQVEAAPAPS
jgi:two-component system, OmpR family, sensor kinase